MARYSQILVKGTPAAKARVASTPITPGMLLDPDEAGGVRRHRFTATEPAGAPSRLFALEKAGMAGSIDLTYVAGELVETAQLNPGDEINALISPLADAVAVRDLLVSAGDGCLKKADATTGGSVNTVGRALEAVDNHLGTTPVRIWLEIVTPSFG